MEKKNVKNELKHYDTCFKTCYGRLPKREEKEPMRPLYMYYKRIKQTMSKKTPDSRPSQANREAATKSLISLRQERNELRTKLHSFQHEFSRTNNRKIRYHKDISPVEGEYKRYKEVKLEITKYESMLSVKH
jgi:chromosome segregation ATPase